MNLIIASQKVGFDYGLTPAELGRKLIADTEVLWRKKIVLSTSPARNRPSERKAKPHSDWKKETFAND